MTNIFSLITYPTHPYVYMGVVWVGDTNYKKNRNMKEKIIKLLQMRLTETTKHNEIWKNSTHVLIYNPLTHTIKIKPL